jgi:guanylate kinase
VSVQVFPFPAPDHGALFVVSGPSGAGKTTLLKRVLEDVPRVRFSVSATTRPPRPGEVDGKDYHFLVPAEFEAKVADDAFLEHATVYGNRYGTLAQPVREALATGWSILLDIDVQGAAQIRTKMPEAVTVFILPPSIETLESRLKARSTDSEAVIARRVEEATEQLSGVGVYDYLVVNEVLDASVDILEAILVAELHRVTRHPSVVSRFRPD